MNVREWKHMQVNNQTIRQQQLTLSETPLELKQGEVVRAAIKETLSDTEAIIYIKEKEVRARFSEGVPVSGKAVTIQVNGQADGMIQAKTIDTETIKTPSAEEKIFATAGLTGKESTGVKEAVKILLDKGVSISKETVQELDSFIEKAQGTLEEKIDTVRALANKRLEATSTQLRAVHEALHGRPLNEVLADIAREIDPEFKVEKSVAANEKQQSQTTPDGKIHNDSAADAVKKMSSPALQAVSKIESKPVSQTIKQMENHYAVSQNDTALKETETKKAALKNHVVNSPEGKQTMAAKQVFELSRTIRRNLELVQKEPDLKQVVAKIREEIVKDPKLDRELAQKIDKAAQEAIKLQSIGKERLVEALKNAEAQLTKKSGPSAIQRNVSIKQSVENSRETKLSTLAKTINQAVSKSPNLKQSIENVKGQMINNQRFPIELKEKVNRAVDEAAILEKQGRITTGKELLSRVLTEVEASVVQVEKKAAQQTSAVYRTSQERNIVEQSLSVTVKEVKAEIQKEPTLQRAVEKVREQVILNPKINRVVALKVEQAVKEAVQLQQTGRETTGREGSQQALAKAEVELQKIEVNQPKQSAQSVNETEPRPSETVKEVMTAVQKEASLQRVVEKVREQVIANPKVEREVAQKVEQAVKEAVQLQQIGRETTDSERLQQALAKAEGELQQIKANQLKQPAQLDTTELRPSETVKELKAEIQKEANLQRAAEKVQEQLSTNPNIDREVAQKIEQAAKVSLKLAQIGRTEIGQGHIQTALTQAEKELQQLEAIKPVQNIQDSHSEQNTHSLTKQEQLSEASQVRDSIKNVREQIQSESDTRKTVQKVQDLLANNKIINPEITRNIERLAGQADQLNQAGRDRLVKMLQQVETVLQQKVEAQGQTSSFKASQTEQPDINLAQQTNGTNNQATAAAKTEVQILPSQSINQALTKLLKEPKLEAALDQVRKEISSNPTIDLKTIEKIEKALDHTQQLNDKGREIAARQKITKELTEIEKDLVKSEPKSIQEAKPKETQSYDLNDQLQSLNIPGKDILITKVTQKLAQATHDFRELKREITRNLDNIERVINTFKKNAYPQVKQMLEATISKLDNSILKSEMMLFTDMRTEKQLLQASTQLAEAKKLLAKGDHAQSGKIVHDVKSLIDKFIFKPSQQKIVHFVDKEVLGMENRSPSQQLLSKMGESTYNANQNHEGSARQMYDMVRSLGLNHESDVANSLVFNRNDQSGQEQQHNQNLKEVLMKLVHGDGQDSNPRVAQQAEQALTNLTGQQLLSKSDGNGTLQSMLFNLPLMLGGKPENLQVFINSKNEGQQVEWENCNLYFLLETKKLGDVGILLNSTDRNLSITIKNDLPGFKEKMEPIAEMTKAKLQEVGYNISSIHFARMSPDTSLTTSHEELGNEIAQAKLTKQLLNEKGMNFTI